MTEPPSDPLTHAWRPEQVTAMDALHEWAVGYAEMNQHLATWMGVPLSDATALGHVAYAAEAGAPLSPAQLSRRTGMTSGATTVLLDRLERAGLIVRSRENADRRRVTLRPSEEGRARTRSFAAFAGAEIAATVIATDSGDLRTVGGFLSRMSAAVTSANDRLHHRGATAPPP